MDQNKLTLSSDRKTSPGAKWKSDTFGWMGVVKNAFAIPAGTTCPGATEGPEGCLKPCYARRLEYVFPLFGKLVQRNYEILRAARTEAGMVLLLDDLMTEWRKEQYRAERKFGELPRIFRIHADGDFFSVDYAKAWARIIKANHDVQFWTYTRSFTTVNVVPELVGIPNLALYLSVDPVNRVAADEMYRQYAPMGLQAAFMAGKFEDAQGIAVDITGRRQPKCPEGWKVPLITENGGACTTCGLCVEGRRSVLFSTTDK